VAIDRLQRLIAATPSQASAHWALGYVHLMLGQWADAIKEFELYQRAIPDHPDTRAYRAYAHAQLGNIQEARVLAVEAEQMLTKYRVPPFYTRAVIAVATGHGDDVVPLLRQARDERDAKFAHYLGSIDPVFSRVRSDPRVTAITTTLTKAGLTPCRLPSGSPPDTPQRTSTR
jgi:tetratricopeptide (TPR) repeat protein